MADPTTNNQAAGVVNDILKAIIEGAGVSEVSAAIIAQVPFFALPVINQIFEWVLGILAGYFYAAAANAATKIVVDVQVNMEKSAVLNSFQELQQAIASGDKDAVALASKDLDDAYASIIHSDGSAPP